MLLFVKKSTRKSKKLMAIFSNGRVTHFGGAKCKDFPTYKRLCGHTIAAQKREAYLARHGATEDWTDPYAASTLSRYILWEFPWKQAIRKYNALFFKQLG